MQRSGSDDLGLRTEDGGRRSEGGRRRTEEGGVDGLFSLKEWLWLLEHFAEHSAYLQIFSCQLLVGFFVYVFTI